jgi:hypothetical protein
VKLLCWITGLVFEIMMVMLMICYDRMEEIYGGYEFQWDLNVHYLSSEEDMPAPNTMGKRTSHQIPGDNAWSVAIS